VSAPVPNGAAPLVSVVIPAHNAARTIVAALESVAAQTFTDWEIVLCDDASTDETRAAAEGCMARLGVTRCRILALSPSGPAEARNHGIRDARGEFVAFLDDDDTWEPTKLARCVEAIRARALDVVCHSEVWLDADTGARTVHHYSPLFDARLHPLVSLMRNNPFSTSALVVRRRHLVEAGLFDPSLPSAEDYDLWIRLAMIPGVRIGFVDEALGTYLLRAGSESSKIDRRLRALLAIGERYGDALAKASRWGALEGVRYRGKTYFTSGVRYAQQGSRARGAAMALKGLLMWPFRWEWVMLAVRQRAARRGEVGS
jgi:glycosyltransferase involved in cell wall biosynthesis